MANVITIAQISEISSIIKLMLEYYPFKEEQKKQFIEQSKQLLETDIESGKRVIFIAKQQDQVNAKLCLQTVDMLPNDKKVKRQFGYLSNLYVSSKYQGKGIARELIEHAISYAKKHEFERLILWPSTSKEFYEKFNFTQGTCVMELSL